MPYVKSSHLQDDKFSYQKKIYLQGGRNNTIQYIENCVHRPVGSWTNQVHQLLLHLRSRNFYAAPEPFGYDTNGREVISFIKGHVSNYPLSPQAASIESLLSAAQLLCRYHNATEDFLSLHAIDHTKWQLPSRNPMEVMCHSDFAPYNVVLDGHYAVGIIDFDTCHPGPRIWDLAYALYRWSPFKNPKNLDSFGSIQDQIERAKLFCRAYGINTTDRKKIPLLMVERLTALIEFMKSQVEQGEQHYTASFDAGHDQSYLLDIEYIQMNQEYIEDKISI